MNMGFGAELSSVGLIYLVTVGTGAVSQTAPGTPATYSAAQAKRGESTYQQNCASCHGSTLRGSEGGPALAGPDFSAKWEGIKLSELFEYTKKTMPQSAPGSLADKQYADVLAFVLSHSGVAPGDTDLPWQTELLDALVYRRPRP